MSIQRQSNIGTEVQRRRWIPACAGMTRGVRGGFSLIEILFAVLILSMGMIFVSMQFPVGLANSRQLRDKTVKVINAHNAKVTMEIQFSGISQTVILTIPDYQNSLIVADGNVHFLPKVNLLNDGTLVVDDPEDMLGLGPVANQDYTQTSFYGGTPPDFFPPYMSIDDNDNLKLGNLGLMMSPAIQDRQ